MNITLNPGDAALIFRFDETTEVVFPEEEPEITDSAEMAIRISEMLDDDKFLDVLFPEDEFVEEGGSEEDDSGQPWVDFK